MKRLTFLSSFLLAPLAALGFSKRNKESVIVETVTTCEYRIEIEVIATPHIMLEYKDEQYGDQLLPNYRHTFWAFIADVLLIPKSLGDINVRSAGAGLGIKYLTFESEPFVIGELKEERYQEFYKKFKDSILKNNKQFKSIHEVPNRIKFSDHS
jgi:hypothetical protein